MKKIIWIGSSKEDLMDLPKETRKFFGVGLQIAQSGKKHSLAKPLKGFGGSSVMELVKSDANGTYRAVYTTQIKEIIFVLHVFQKKSKHGISTPKKDIDLIKNRLKKIFEHITGNKL